MASFTKINDFVADVANGVHDLSSDTVKIALSNTAPGDEESNPTEDGNGQLSNVTEISYTNIVGQTLTVSSSTQTSGTYKLVITDFDIEASGGNVGPFQYIYLYNETATNDELIGYYDYGSAVTLSDGEKLNLDFDDGGGVITIA